MTVLRRTRVPFTLVLVAIGAAFLSQTANTTVARGPSCPLPVGRQVKAVKAFQAMMPVFRHPRCFNCHGGVNPFIEKTGPDPADTAAPAGRIVAVIHHVGIIKNGHVPIFSVEAETIVKHLEVIVAGPQTPV